MIRSAHLVRKPSLYVAVVFAAVAPAFAEGETTTRQSARKDIGSFDSLLKVMDEASAAVEARIAKEQYETRGAEIALQINNVVASSQENAAFLYYHALLARHEVDPCTVGPFLAVLRDEEPNARVRVYLGQCLKTLELVQIASQMPRCDWGPLNAQGQRLDTNLAPRLRQLCFLLSVDARTLSADGHHRAAMSRCLTMRRLAHHTGDDTYLLYEIAQGADSMALRSLVHILSIMPPDAEILKWLRNQLAAVPAASFQLGEAMQKWRDAELQSWRARPKGRPFTRKWFLEATNDWDEDQKKRVAAFTDEQALVFALTRRGLSTTLSVPPELIERMRIASDAFLKFALRVMESDATYSDKDTQLRSMVDWLRDRTASYAPIALVSDTPRTVEIYYRLMTHNIGLLNITRAAIEVLLIRATTGRLPQVLPDDLPKDPFSGKDFEYERTKGGFVLRFDAANVSGIQIRQYEFRVSDSDSPNP